MKHNDIHRLREFFRVTKYLPMITKAGWLDGEKGFVKGNKSKWWIKGIRAVVR